MDRVFFVGSRFPHHRRQTMAEERYVCKKCGALFTAESEQDEPLDCSDCGSEQIAKFVDTLYAKDHGDVKGSVEAHRRPKK